MSLTHPIIIDDQGEFIDLVKSTTSDFLVGKIELTLDHFNDDLDFLFDTFKTLFLFDFEKDTTLLMGTNTISCETFDYFNPLIVSKDMLSKMFFYKKDVVGSLRRITCYCLILDRIQEILSKMTLNCITYPFENVVIDYTNGLIIRTPNQCTHTQIFTTIFKVYREPVIQNTLLPQGNASISNVLSQMLESGEVYGGLTAANLFSQMLAAGNLTFDDSEEDVPEDGEEF